MGKSTVAEAFARSEYESYILIDFSNTSSEIKELFDDISDLREFFLKLQLHCNVTLRERRSLIIFDEVQLFPRARQAIAVIVALVGFIKALPARAAGYQAFGGRRPL